MTILEAYHYKFSFLEYISGKEMMFKTFQTNLQLCAPAIDLLVKWQFVQIKRHFKIFLNCVVFQYFYYSMLDIYYLMCL